MKGIHHLGLSVSNLEESCKFFCGVLGWHEVRRVEEYPAIFVTNDEVMFTLWQTSNQANAFDRRDNVGLHHVAFSVESEEELSALYKKLSNVAHVSIEFGPELLRGGPAKHMICYEPSGIRVEFIWVPAQPSCTTSVFMH
ncbi:MAG: VOC family protein [Acidiferrobacterales bacterium]|nr:VOC family protein [Acidiferrobacterales bacterium]